MESLFCKDEWAEGREKINREIKDGEGEGES